MFVPNNPKSPVFFSDQKASLSKVSSNVCRALSFTLSEPYDFVASILASVRVASSASSSASPNQTGGSTVWGSLANHLRTLSPRAGSSRQRRRRRRPGSGSFESLGRVPRRNADRQARLPQRLSAHMLRTDLAATFAVLI